MKRKRISISKAGIILFFMFAGSVAVIGQTRLIVQNSDHTEQIFTVSENGKVYFSDDYLIVDEGDGYSELLLISEIRKILLSVSSTTSIADAKEVDDMKVYPNPVQDFIYISGGDAERMSVKIFSLTGRILLQGEYTAGEAIDASSLMPGFYMMEVNRKTFKIIKR